MFTKTVFTLALVLSAVTPAFATDYSIGLRNYKDSMIVKKVAKFYPGYKVNSIKQLPARAVEVRGVSPASQFDRLDLHITKLSKAGLGPNLLSGAE